MDHEALLQNRATCTGGAPDSVFCPHCDEFVIFALRDSQHEFSIGLTTVLECLCFAEKMGYVPPLPEEWLSSVHLGFSLHCGLASYPDEVERHEPRQS